MGACFCTGACRRPPYRCAAGDFSSRYDPDYEKRIGQAAVAEYLRAEAEKRRRRTAEERRLAEAPRRWTGPPTVAERPREPAAEPLDALRRRILEAVVEEHPAADARSRWLRRAAARGAAPRRPRVWPLAAGDERVVPLTSDGDAPYQVSWTWADAERLRPDLKMFLVGRDDGELPVHPRVSSRAAA